jgi:hypothetical protein
MILQNLKEISESHGVRKGKDTRGKQTRKKTGEKEFLKVTLIPN